MRDRREVGHEGLKLGQVGRHAFEDEIDLARQHPAFPNQRLAAHESLERLQVGLGLARQMHHGERDHLAAQLLLVEKRAIAANVAGLLEGAHTAQAGRRRDADPPRQFDIGHAAVLLKLAQDMEVDGIEASHGRISDERQGQAALAILVQKAPHCCLERQPHRIIARHEAQF